MRNVATAVKTFPGVKGSLSKTHRANVAVETASGDSQRKKMFMARTYINFVNQLRSESRISSIFALNVSSQAYATIVQFALQIPHNVKSGEIKFSLTPEHELQICKTNQLRDSPK